MVRIRIRLSLKGRIIMRKLLLAAGLCLVAVALMPVASASAYSEYYGACTFYGEATIGKAINVPALTNTTFNFTEKAAGGIDPAKNTCVSNAGEKKVEEAEVAGEGELQCAVSENLAGELKAVLTGKISGNIKKLKIESKNIKGEPSFKFVAVGGDVAFAVNGEETSALGDATFLTSATNLEECLPTGKGKNLTFEAAATGKFTTEP
jgi:hypothetical protein